MTVRLIRWLKELIFLEQFLSSILKKCLHLHPHISHLIKLIPSKNIEKPKKDLAKLKKHNDTHHLQSTSQFLKCFVYNMPLVLHNNLVSYGLCFDRYTNEAVKRRVQTL